MFFYNKQKIFNIFYFEKAKKLNIFLQKGYKTKNLGIYSKNLYDIDHFYIIKNVNFIFIIRFKRKNLFLTLLNNDGNVLCKTNIGSCGFKKKVKYTGYAIKRTSKIFLEKVVKCLISKLYNTYYINNLQKKKKKKKKKLTSIYNKLTFVKNVKNYNFDYLYLKKRKKVKDLDNSIKKKGQYI